VTNWHEGFDEGVRYRFALPVGYAQGTRYPLVLFLHGSGESGDDNTAQLKNGVRQLAALHAPAIIVAPQCPRGQTWGGSWYGGHSTMQDRVVALAATLASRSSVDAHRMYAVGFSMGAIGLWDLLVRHPTRFAAGLTVAGDVDPIQAQALKDVALWAFHGADDAVVKPDNERFLAGWMSANQGRLRYTELPRRAHDIADEVLARPEVLAWLLAQRL
jgi:predicted peptidase